MPEPTIAQKSPYPVAVEVAKTYLLVRLRKKCEPAFL